MFVASDNTALLAPPIRMFRGRLTRPVYRSMGLRGLGITGQQAGGMATSVAATAASLIPGVGIIAGPLVGIVGSIITSLFQPDYNKIAASNDANQVGDAMKQNMLSWLSLPNNQKFVSVQANRLGVFDQLWAQLQQMCGQLPSSDGGGACISDRQQGACKWSTAAPFGWIDGTFVQSGPAVTGGKYCWNYFYFRDAIANDPYVIPDPVQASVASPGGGYSDASLVPAAAGGGAAAAASSGLSSLFSSPVAWLIGAGLLFAVAEAAS
jgi:hypothetical protein